ncbi:MAG: hypothetical protein LBR44_07980 [Clostridiales Family XIII bacterium]|nr:hypothetical protein [Clostridiales Family XIII bacterium]
MSNCQKTRTIMRPVRTGAVFVPLLLLLGAWGPGRDTFSLGDDTTGLVAFNSIVDESIEDIADAEWMSTFATDERQFMNIKEKGSPGDDWNSSEPNAPDESKLHVEEGKTYRVRILVHNVGESTSAKNTRALVNVSTPEPDTHKVITAFINADNATPQSIWDDCELVSDQPFNIRYIPGSVEYKYNNNWTAEHEGYVPLSDSIFSSNGVKLGYSNYDDGSRAFDGVFPGGYEYSGWIFFDIIPQFVSQDTIVENDIVTTSIKEYGASETWGSTLDLTEGDLVQVKVQFKNISDRELQSVIVRAKLEDGLQFVDDSLTLSNNESANKHLAGDPTMLGGVDIGACSVGEMIVLEYLLRIDKDIAATALVITNEVKFAADRQEQTESSSAFVRLDARNASGTYIENQYNIDGNEGAVAIGSNAVAVNTGGGSKLAEILAIVASVLTIYSFIAAFWGFSIRGPFGAIFEKIIALLATRASGPRPKQRPGGG